MSTPAWDELDPPRIVYVPRLIETAEQAAALPDGITLTHEKYWPCEKVGDLFVGNDWHMSKPANVVGWTALVPVEVYEGPGGHGPSWYIQADEYDR